MRYRLARRISPTSRLGFLALTGLVLASLSGQALAKGKYHHKAWSKAAKKAEAAPAPVEATPPAATPSCGGAWKMAVERQKAGHLTEARELFSSCRAAACLPAVRKECAKQFEQLEADIPSVVAVVTDGSGEPKTDVEVKVDGHVIASSLDGRSVPVDPGVHEFSFASDGGVFATQKIMVAEGQHHRLISAAVPGAGTNAAPASPSKKPTVMAPKKGVPPSLTSAAAAVAMKDPAPAAAAQKDDDADQGDENEGTPTKQESTFHTPALTWVLAGTGLVGIGGYGLLTYWGRKDTADLNAQCGHSCLPSSADHVHKLYLGADISAGVGLAALVASYFVYSHAKSVGKEQTETETAYMFGVQPTSAGAVGTISGTF